MISSRLRVARERLGRLGGRKAIADAAPQACERARELSGSLRSISKRLADEGLVASSGKSYGPSVILKMRTDAKIAKV
jgi:hypothetical protein